MKSSKPKSTPKKVSKTKRSVKSREATSSVDIGTVRRILGGYMVVLMLLQLFTFERFPGLLQSAGMSEAVATVVAILLVIVELVALPFLIGLKSTPLVQKISKVSGFVAIAMLSIVEIMAAMSGVTVMFGATFDLPGGGWSIMIIISLWLLLIWSTGLLQRWDRPVNLPSRLKK